MNLDDPVTHTPTAIERIGDTGIRILWSDGQTTQWTAQQLRDVCPCATCREKRGKLHGDATSDASAKTPPSRPLGLPVLSAAEAQPTRIEGMQPVGTYAYNIAFSDGHHSGLFTFARLRRDEE
ncbi:DUF971 domain-containing protein [Allorhodopirellula heiligendammensis]|uniref:Gamma-butyrobetaine hydroxylase-like N-terminal domain-containing protein n=1 Tax=Allorhodopirellula heiligendammensis TaxID=2714739 RepID=A0A5C6C293_9BACT|nr:DUF971 domain-containing protein [Allorhodopirellula heiligendammensis]TWU18205.1 hypothetical protein Poly21_03600 [Allorhodopirellula heiligendammensis]